MSSRSRWIARSSLVAVLAVGGLAACVPPPVPGPPTATCNSRANDTYKKLLDCVKVEGVREHQAQFQRIADNNGGTRSSGTPGYDVSAEYAARVLRNAGYEVTVQEFMFEYSEEMSSLTQLSPTPEEYEGVLMNAFDPPVEGDATGIVHPVDVVIPPGAAANTSTSGCEAADFAGMPAGAIALIQRGSCDFVLKAANADAAGAAGVVIFNEGQPGRDGLLSGTGSSAGIDIPVVFVPFAVGESLYDDSLEGPVTVEVVADQTVEMRPTTNILAETKTGNDDEVVMVGAHLDSVIEGPGINDNGSGSAAVLEVAENMARVNPTNTVRFALWGAEEFGLLGSEYYVENLTQEQSDDIALYLNFDMVGSPNHFTGVYDGDGSTFGLPGPAGSSAIEARFEEFYEGRNLPYQDTDFSGRSDYGPFIAIGIPAGGLFTGAEDVKTAAEVALYGGQAGVAYDPCYHQACDTFENVNLTALDQNSDAVAWATLTYAKSTASVSVGNRVAARAMALEDLGVNHNRPGERVAS
jgi:Zn-dependent M28 family amino/carboxypeptidase